MSEGTQTAGRRFRVITIDQAIAGASNVLIAVLAARLLSVSAFGFFGLVFLVYVMVQGVARALVCDPLLVHPEEAAARRGEIIGTSCVLGLGLAGVVLLAGLAGQLWDGRLGDALLVLALFLPLLVFQDLGRYLAFATQRPGSAVVLDGTWLVLQFAAVGALFATDTHSLAWFIAAWAGSGAAAGLLLFRQHGLREVRVGLSWLRYTWPFSWRYLISYVATQGAALGASGGVGAIAGPKALGGLQGATLLVRPFVTVQVAAIAASVGEVARSVGEQARLRRFVVKVTAVVTAMALVNAVVLLVLPDAAGEAVLGDSWSEAQRLLLPTGVQIVCLALMTGVRAGLLGMRAIQKVMRLDIAGTVIVLAASIIGAVIDGVLGALWAVAVGQALLATAWWLTFLLHVPEPAAAAEEDALAVTIAGVGDGAAAPAVPPAASLSVPPPA